MTKIDFRLRQQCNNRTACSTVQPEFCRYTSGRLPMHHQRMWASSLAVIPQTLSLPPANRVKFNKKFYICSDVTHTHAFTHRGFYTQTPLHTDAFQHRSFYTQKLLHTEAFTHRGFCTQTPLHTEAFTHRSCYTQKLLHTDTSARKHFHTQKLLHTNTFTHRDRTREIAILLQFLTFNVHFVRKGCHGPSKITILPQFLASNLHFACKGCP